MNITYLTWCLPSKFDDGEDCLIAPHSDPMQYEYPADGIFDTREAAVKYLHEYEYFEEARDDKWLLVKVTQEVVGGVDA